MRHRSVLFMASVLRRFLVVALLVALPRAVAAEQGEFLVISDIHFNPFNGLSKAQFQTLSGLPANQWPAFFQSLDQPVVRPGSNTDTNYTLLVSALDAARQRLPNAPFILYPGDFMGHNWQDNYDGLAPQTIEQNPSAFREFTTKALTLLAGEFKQRFPNTPVLATLGNDDSFCEDYWIQPNGDFLSTFADVWQPLLGTAVQPKVFRKSFSSLGAYCADLPGLSGDRLLVLNSVLWSASYCSTSHDPTAHGHNCCRCTNPDSVPGASQFIWLEAQLALAQKQNKRVWLLMHVPPGLDSYALDNGSRAANQWTPAFTARYLRLIDQYRDTLHTSFTGHTHMDDYRVDRISGEPVLLHKIAPAVSPIFGNNPSFQVFQLDTTSAVISNWQTHYFNLATPSGGQPPTDKWAVEYDAHKTYGLGEVTAKSIDALFVRMKSDQTGAPATAYRNFYEVSASPIAQSDLMIYVCAVLSATYAEYHQCVTGHGLPAPKHVAEPALLRRAAGGLAAPGK